MSCSSCSSGKDGKAAGCKSNGGCDSGGCNRMNTFNWLSDDIYFDDEQFNIVEISFKNGVHKGFFRNTQKLALEKGMLVCVDSTLGFGYDIGAVSLMGEMVKWQMKKRKVKEDSDLIKNILRVAKDNEVTLLDALRDKEPETMVRARAIARELKLNMKLADVEYQADGKKCTYYYIADGRVDFRELIKIYAKDFNVRVEMRQIGIRQEAALVGGIGVCGRELCCSTWLTDFKSVNTTIARYQQLSINQLKLSGQCGRLKCCLNYELDTYVDALQVFPKADRLQAAKSDWTLSKTDVFKKKMYYQDRLTYQIVALDLDAVREIQRLNREGVKPDNFTNYVKQIEEKKEYVDNVGDLSLTLKKLEKTTQIRKDREKNRTGDRSRPGSNAPQGTRSKPFNSPPQEGGAPSQAPRPPQGNRPNPNNSQNKKQQSNPTARPPQANRPRPEGEQPRNQGQNQRPRPPQGNNPPNNTQDKRPPQNDRPTPPKEGEAG